MEFNEKLQELRKRRGLTQEELAQAIFVSRTAISKWESGRGYPNIESLKAIAKFFGVTVDELLSGEEILTVAEEDSRRKEKHYRDLVLGLLDCSSAMFLFLPFFRQSADGFIRSVSLLSLAEISGYMRVAYYAVLSGTVLTGVLTLAMQNCETPVWLRLKDKISLLCNVAGVFLFVISLQPYAAIFLLVFLIIKALLMIKWH